MNQIIDLPDLLCDISTLLKLNVERNKLSQVPPRIKALNLVELRIGHNSIEMLPDDMFEGPLGEKCKFFSCCENNLLELPLSLAMIDMEAYVEADSNPLKSPPQGLLSEGTKVIRNYLQIRTMRLKELEELMVMEDFEFVRENVVPTSCEVLADGTGFLTPNDLAEFDQACDEYLNGEYYKCPCSGPELVQSLADLRDFRETELYLLVLHTFLDILQKISKEKEKRFKKAVLFTTTRPWGRKGEQVNCWAISLTALLKDTPPNPYQKNGRPSIIEMVQRSLPEMAFPFTADLLKDALRLYQSPYGQVADTEQVTFPSCDCIDEKRNKPKKHNPCKKAAVVLAKSIYIQEEADRREIEENEYLMRWEELESDIKIWLETEQGKKELDKEFNRRKAGIEEECNIRQELVNIEQQKETTASEKIDQLQIRKVAFEVGEAYEKHGFTDITEAIKAIKEQEIIRENAEKRKQKLSKDLKPYLAQRNITKAARKKIAIEDLMQKYCVLCHKDTVKHFRFYAAERGVKRHWDGPDGKHYKEWFRKFATAGKPSDTELAALLDEAMEEYNKHKADEKRMQLQNGVDLPDYDWKGCEEMSNFDLPLYLRYKNSKINLANAINLAKSAGSYLFNRANQAAAAVNQRLNGPGEEDNNGGIADGDNGGNVVADED